jgi:diguanylate cyclase (GGDEF)-like protein
MMQSPIKRRELLIIVTLAFTGLSLAGGAYWVLSSTVDRMVRSDAEHTAEGWNRYIAQQLRDLEQIAAGSKPSMESERIIRNASLVGNVFRFKVFDPSGQLRLVSDEPDKDWKDQPSLVKHNPPAAQAVLSGTSFTDIKKGTPPGRPEVYAETYLPVLKDGKRIAIVEVYVDQTARQSMLRGQVAVGAIALAVLTLVAFGLPSAAFHFRTRQRQRAEERVLFLSQHDGMTSLLNRSAFAEQMDIVLAQGSAVVLFIDLDRFKEVNDGLGHDIGDEMLRATAHRLRHCVHVRASVGRLGGDEFAVLVPFDMTTVEVERLCERIIAMLSSPVSVNGHDVVVRASIGVAIAPANGTDSTALLRCSDLALYAAKAGGRNTYCFFTPALEADFLKRRKIEALIRSKSASEGFELYFQPLVCTDTQKIVGFEALLRMQDEDGGFIGPDVFIPIAEAMGLISVIGAFVLDRACHTAASWPEELTIAVNLSPLQFSTGDLVRSVQGALERSGLGPHRLELEITEGLLLHHTESVIEELAQLKALGAAIVMDDFGTGYSSLSYLWRFPFDKIKVDRSFMAYLTEETSDAANIVRSVIGLGHSLRMSVTAEGVETIEQAAFLKSLNCDYLQGFHFGRPMPATEVATHILAQFSNSLPPRKSIPDSFRYRGRR